MSSPSSSKGTNLADDMCGAYAGAEQSEILEDSSDPSSSEGKKLADDTCEDDHVPFASSDDDHIHFSSEDEGEEGHISSSTHIHLPSEDEGEEDHISSSTRVDDEWVSKMKKKCLCMPTRLKPSSGSKSCSIHRVPYSLRKHNDDAYNPQLISIGPFHYEKRKTDQLRSMEEHKWNYLHDIISRKHPRWLEKCYVKIKKSEKDARSCYSEEIQVNSNDFDFMEMMVLDGCFIVEFLRRFWLSSCKRGVFTNDVIIQLAWPARALWCDLLLMENQIPFFILQDLSDLIDADLEVASAKFPPLIEMALNFIFPGNSTVVSIINTSEILHLLHLLYVGCVPQPATEDINLSPEERKNGKGIRPRIPCASKLKEAGIGFKRMDYRDCFHIRFHNGMIEIPLIYVSDFTKKKFLNLIAFEQCYQHCSKLITNFASFMDSLIDTAKDVEILHLKEIIYNALGDDTLVASEFCSIAREESISYDPHYLTDVCKEINEYSSRFWPRSRASFVHDYCKNPWALVSVIAGLLLLLFAFTQTFFTAFPKFAYKNWDKKHQYP